jgi:hypothetical protein
MAALSALLRAVILAACVAGAIAGAPSEEWAERLRLLETRVEQSDQREAEQLRLFETGIAQSKQREAALHKRVAFLEGTVQRLRPSSEQAEATAPKVRTGKVAVRPMGEPEAVGRRLNAPTCCRWTADGTCGTVPAERFEVCTHMHEYLETKTTTHEFADLDTCLGPDASKWSAKFDRWRLLRCDPVLRCRGDDDPLKKDAAEGDARGGLQQRDADAVERAGGHRARAHAHAIAEPGQFCGSSALTVYRLPGSGGE